MGAIVLLAAAAAAQEQRRRARDAARRREEERKKQENKNNSNRSHSSSSERIPYLDCLMYEIKADETLSKFFAALKDNAERAREEQGKSLRDEAQNIANMIEKYLEGRLEIEKRLVASGIEVRSLLSDYYSMDSFSIISKEDPHSDQCRQITTGVTFNGLDLSLNSLDNTRFRERYESQKEKCDGLRIEKGEKEELIKKQESLLKYVPFGKNARRDVIAKTKKELKEIERELEREERLRKELETFESFTPSQIQDIRKYLEATICMYKAMQSIRSKAREFAAKVPKIDEKTIIEKALEATMDELHLGEEELADIFRRMDKVAIKRYRGEFDDEGIYYDFSDYGLLGRKKDLVRGFIKHVYEEDPEFAERNMVEVIKDEESREQE